MREFYQEYVKPGKPVRIRKMTEEWGALANWNTEYFRQIEGGVKIATKTGDVSAGNRVSMLLSEYVALLEDYEAQLRQGEKPPKPPYLHDVPIFHLLPGLRKDIEPFPLELFPKWYWEKYYNYIQFFMGATGSLTPLHFDTLCTHNLFFQVAGGKKFILIAPEQKELCYVDGWRWARFDPANPDYDTFPKARDVQSKVVTLGAGDILYMPPRTLHQVHGLSYSISFNIDWHTVASARDGARSFREGAPEKNSYYNALMYSALKHRIPSELIFPYYQTYLNYVS